MYYLLVGPKGLPPEISTAIHDGVKKAIGDPLFRKTMEGKGFDIAYEGPQALKNRLVQDYERNAKLVQTLNLKE